MKIGSGGKFICVFGLFMAIVLIIPASSWAHGFAGQRFFPTTFAVDDPFISDEFSILYNYIKTPDARTSQFDLGVSKRILPNFGIEIGESFQHLHFNNDGRANGFSNLDLGLKYQFLTSAEHETIMSLGVDAEIGGTGDRGIGADSSSTISPAFFFGKGFGDLPDSLKYVRPLAFTGVIGPNFPTRDSDPNTLTWAFTAQYSLVYLTSFVKDVGLPDPLRRMVVIVEFPMETDLDGNHGQTTGTINPGVAWVGKYMELGVAAEVPINDRTGHNVGVFGLVHLFIDDLFPNSIGRPIFSLK